MYVSMIVDGAEVIYRPVSWNRLRVWYPMGHDAAADFTAADFLRSCEREAAYQRTSQRMHDWMAGKDRKIVVESFEERWSELSHSS